MTALEVGNELNEAGWWSNWGHLTWFTPSCYGLISRDFREPLFNHSGFIDSNVPLRKILPHIEQWYNREKFVPSFFLKESEEYESLRDFLSSKGYSPSDKHLVMSLAHPRFERQTDVECTFVGEGRANDWSATYLSAFYGEQSLFPAVLESVKRALRGGRSKLLLAEYDGKIAGALAIHAHAGFSGVYCVGTVPELRGKGVATQMLAEASRFAQERKTKLVLQTFSSDAVEQFYLRLGFETAYSKDVLVI